MKIIKRLNYLKRIRQYIDKAVIKVITGMRRSGKSCFLKQIINELQENKVKPIDILYIDKDNLDFDHIKDYKDLNEYINENLSKNKRKKYLFIDEIQEIQDWQKTITSYFNKGQIDIFITGSNAHMLSSELATRLTGRYIEFPIYTLSFKEFLDDFRVKPSKDIEKEFYNYIKFGSLPAIHHFELQQEIVYPYISSIVDTVVLKDIISKNEIRNIRLLENIIDFVLENIGSTFSAKGIADYLKSQKITMGIETIQNYLSYLEAAYIVKKVSRYDLKGKKILEINEKYYLNDLGIRHTRVGFREDDISDFLENLVFYELIRRGYTVTIGKLTNLEIDFIAEKDNQRTYIQVCYTLLGKKSNEKSKSIRERETEPFFKLFKSEDFSNKLLITMDKISNNNDSHIFTTMNIIEFLLDEKLLRSLGHK